MKLTEDDIEQLQRYDQEIVPTPEVVAFFAQLPRRVRRATVDTLVRELVRGSGYSAAELERIPENAALAIWPNGVPWR